MKLIFFGATEFSKALLLHLLKNKFAPAAIFTIPETFARSYSSTPVANVNFANLGEIARQYDIPLFSVESGKGKRIGDYKDIIKSIEPDLILVLGWYYLVPRRIRDLARHGAWGIHASLLPKYAGGAPLVWTIINGERETGVTLFRLDDGVDSGDIIYQKDFPIGYEDTIKEVYEKATEASKVILMDALNHIDTIRYKPQDKADIKIYPQRTPEDGKIDWNKPAIEIYNFIRAQSDPYPGAFVRTIDKKKLVIDKAHIEE